VGVGHEERAESELDVGDALAVGILDVLAGSPATGLFVGEDAHHELDFGDERAEVRLGLTDLNVRAQAFDVPGGQSQPMPAREIEHRRKAKISVEVSMEVDEGNGGVRHATDYTQGRGPGLRYAAEVIT
jgi:hypothetical protein